MPSFKIESDAQWHALRAQNIGGSEVAALIGEHPHVTAFELYHRKAGALPPTDYSDNQRVFWGTVLEPAVALGTAKKTGWSIRKVRRYITHDEIAGMGCSCDYEILNHERGPGVLSIKTADWTVFRTWPDGEPPLHYELQVQHELACTGRTWGAIAVLVAGNDLRVYEYLRRPKVVSLLEGEVIAFWERVRAGTPPKPEFHRDASLISSLYREVQAAEVKDMSGDNRLPELCEQYQRGLELEKTGEKQKSAALAEIVTKIGDAGIAICNGWRIKSKHVGEAEIAAYTRRGYRRTTITQQAPQEET